MLGFLLGFPTDLHCPKFGNPPRELYYLTFQRLLWKVDTGSSAIVIVYTISAMHLAIAVHTAHAIAWKAKPRTQFQFAVDPSSGQYRRKPEEKRIHLPQASTAWTSNQLPSS